VTAELVAVGNGWKKLPSAVHIAAVPDAYDVHQKLVVADGIDDTVVADAQTPLVPVGTDKRGGAICPRGRT
jgi:hypothetical protein